jgi:hypothetical protein
MPQEESFTTYLLLKDVSDAYRAAAWGNTGTSAQRDFLITEWDAHYNNQEAVDELHKLDGLSADDLISNYNNVLARITAGSGFQALTKLSGDENSATILYKDLLGNHEEFRMERNQDGSWTFQQTPPGN